jgi:hypothetical protein
MNATQPLKILMPPGRRRDDSEKPQSAGDLFALSEKEKGTNSALAFDNRHAFRDDMFTIYDLKAEGRDMKTGTKRAKQSQIPADGMATWATWHGHPFGFALRAGSARESESWAGRPCHYSDGPEPIVRNEPNSRRDRVGRGRRDAGRGQIVRNEPNSWMGKNEVKCCCSKFGPAWARPQRAEDAKRTQFRPLGPSRAPIIPIFQHSNPPVPVPPWEISSEN